MDGQMQILWSKFKEELQLQTAAITQNITASISATIEEKIKPILEENQILKKEVVVVLKTRVQHLERETRRNNVILHGIPESEQNKQELMEKVLEALNNMGKKAQIAEWDIWELSQVTRLGKQKEGIARPILIQLTLAWRKVEILKNNKQFPVGIYATEDFPKDVLEKRRELKTRLAEEIKNGKTAYIRYDKLIIKDKVEKRKRSPSRSIESTPTSINKQKAPSKIHKTNIFTNTKTRSTSVNETKNN